MKIAGSSTPPKAGFANGIDFDLDLVIPYRGKSLSEGAIEPWTKSPCRSLVLELRRYARANGIPLDVPFCQPLDTGKFIAGGRSGAGGLGSVDEVGGYFSLVYSALASIPTRESTLGRPVRGKSPNIPL